MKLENEKLQYIENYISEVETRLPYKRDLKNRVISDFRADVMDAYKLEEEFASPNNIFGDSDEAAVNIANSVDWNVESAGWWRRLFAFIIDAIISILLSVMSIGVFIASYNLIFGEGRELGESDLIFIDVAIIIFIITFLTFFLTFGVFYVCATEKLYGKTPGKKLLKLIVVDYNGIKIDWQQSIVRNITKFIGQFLLFDFLIGWLVNENPEKSQRAMDVVAKTQVLKLRGK